MDKIPLGNLMITTITKTTNATTEQNKANYKKITHFFFLFFISVKISNNKNIICVAFQ